MDEVMFGQGMLERAAASVQYPSTPRLRARVLARIAETPVESKTRRPAWALPALAAAISLVVAVGAALAVPTSRDAIADFFGIEGSNIEILPTAPAGTTPTPFPTPSEIDPEAIISSRAKAELAVGRPLAVPAALQPESVYLRQYGDSTGVILRFSDFDLWEVDTDGSFDGTFGKGGGPGSVIQDLTVNGRPARWVAGGPHLVRYIDAQGRIDESTERTAVRDTLIWRTEYALYRMETDLPLDEARAIAETLP
jgi:hypothetical protein